MKRLEDLLETEMNLQFQRGFGRGVLYAVTLSLISTMLTFPVLLASLCHEESFSPILLTLNRTQGLAMWPQ